jgi:four helix bundle protein
MHTTFQQIMHTTFQQIRNGIFLGVVSIGSIFAVFLVLFGLVSVLPPLPSPVLFVLTIAFGLLGLGLGLLTVRLKETRIEKTCGENMTLIRDYKEPRVYQAAFEAAMEIFELTKEFPPEEKYSMTDQVRRSSRSVSANIASAWRKNRYPASFVSKLSDAEEEAEETRVWMQFAVRCRYMSEAKAKELDETYDKILGQLVSMISEPEKWTIH